MYTFLAFSRIPALTVIFSISPFFRDPLPYFHYLWSALVPNSKYRLSSWKLWWNYYLYINLASVLSPWFFQSKTSVNHSVPFHSSTSHCSTETPVTPKSNSLSSFICSIAAPISVGGRGQRAGGRGAASPQLGKYSFHSGKFFSFNVLNLSY